MKNTCTPSVEPKRSQIETRPEIPAVHGHSAAHTNNGGGHSSQSPADLAGPIDNIQIAADGPSPFSVFTLWQKRLIVLEAALCALCSSWTAQIYIPSLPTAAKDLGVSISEINLTVTVYMIFQGVTPIFVGGASDVAGRRPAFIVCCGLSIIANIALALTDEYESLLGLRCFQSIAISSAQSLCQAVVADVSTSAERGQYIGFVSLSTTLGPSLGPVIGGSIATYLDWRCTFWFLAICAATNLVILVVIFPETCRNVVGDGSIRPRKENQTVWQLAEKRFRPWRLQREALAVEPEAGERYGIGLTKTRLLTALVLLFEKELALIFLYGGMVFAGVYSIGTAVPAHFAIIYGFTSLQIGLMYLPMALGSILAVALVGPGLNWNFRRHGQRLEMVVDPARQMDLSHFPIERVRLEVIAPWLVLSFGVMVSWGWALHSQAPVPVMCVLVFFVGLGLVGTSNVLNALAVDVRPGKTGSTAAAGNLIKFPLGAAMAAAIEPLVERVGLGKAYTIIASSYVLLLPCLGLVWRNGMQWRAELRDVGEGEGVGETRPGTGTWAAVKRVCNRAFDWQAC